MLVLAAAIHYGPRWGSASGEHAAGTAATPTMPGTNNGNPHPLVDPLVPPIEVAGHLLPSESHAGTLLWNPDSLVGRVASIADFSADPEAHFHAHGEEVCASGCAASNHPTKELTPEYFHELLGQYATEPMDETSFALESLLYFGRQTLVLLNEEGDYPLDPLRSDFLRQELKKTHAKVEVRVVDEHGEVRTWLPPTRVPLDRRHEFDMQVNNVQPLITSGTVKRVGLYHLWNRL